VTVPKLGPAALPAPAIEVSAPSAAQAGVPVVVTTTVALVLLGLARRGLC